MKSKVTTLGVKKSRRGDDPFHSRQIIATSVLDIPDPSSQAATILGARKKCGGKDSIFLNATLSWRWPPWPVVNPTYSVR